MAQHLQPLSGLIPNQPTQPSQPSNNNKLNFARLAPIAAYHKEHLTPADQTKQNFGVHNTPSFINDDTSRSFSLLGTFGASLGTPLQDQTHKGQAHHPVKDFSEIEGNEVIDIQNIQGDVLAGFHKAFQYVVGIQIKDTEGVRKWLAEVVKPLLTNVVDVMKFRDLFRERRIKLGDKVSALNSLRAEGIVDKCVNVSFSFNGLKKLLGEAELKEFGDKDFKEDLLGNFLNENPLSDPNPKTWVVGGEGKQLDILFQIAADWEQVATELKNKLLAGYDDIILEAIYSDLGSRDPTTPGEEHFGFNDGFGQPQLRGVYIDGNGEKTLFTTRQISTHHPTSNHFGNPGQTLLWPGEFLFGHTTPVKNHPENPFLKDGKPAYDEETFGKFPPWAKDGSLLVFRRLKQDVAKFWNFCRSINQTDFNGKLHDNDIGARFVGRWPSGAPLLRTPLHDDTAFTHELSIMDFKLLEDSTATPLVQNNGQPDGLRVAKADPAGRVCPFAAHIRKMNPRLIGAPSDPNIHMILRRGSPYGARIRDRYTDDNGERGLLFVCYASSITQGFRFQQELWANRHDIPEGNANLDGHDVIIGQTPNGKISFNIEIPAQPGNEKDPKYQKVTRKDIANEWVIATGGAYMLTPPLSFFAPGSPLFKGLAQQQQQQKK